MIFDITLNDNDFIDGLELYFEFNYNFRYCCKKLIEKHEYNYEEYMKLEETTDNCYTLLNKDFTELTIEEKHLLENELKKDLICWMRNNNIFGSSSDYVENHLKIKIKNTFKPKWQNGEHLWVYIQPYVTLFALVQ